jgi:hypothetical protein
MALAFGLTGITNILELGKIKPYGATVIFIFTEIKTSTSNLTQVLTKIKQLQ